MTNLPNGTTFPTLEFAVVGGGTVQLPRDVIGDWVAILIYRGSWCPFCIAQLTSFNRAADKLKTAGIRVVALSADDEKTATRTVDEHGISFPVAHSADPSRLEQVLGSYIGDDEDGRYAQSTGFLLRPDGTVAVAVYSSEAIGRLTASDVLGYVAHVREEEGSEGHTGPSEQAEAS